MAFIVTLICANCDITSEFALVRNALYCASTSRYYLCVCMPCTIFWMSYISSWCSSRGGRRCNKNVVRRRGVPSFSCGCYRYSLLLVWSAKEQLVFRPRVLVRSMTSPLTDVIVGNHHCIGDGLYSCSLEFSSLFQFFSQLGKGFCRVVGIHHLHCAILKVDIVDRPVAREQVLDHGECGNLFEPW